MPWSSWLELESRISPGLQSTFLKQTTQSKTVWSTICWICHQLMVFEWVWKLSSPPPCSNQDWWYHQASSQAYVYDKLYSYNLYRNLNKCKVCSFGWWNHITLLLSIVDLKLPNSSIFTISAMYCMIFFLQTLSMAPSSALYHNNHLLYPTFAIAGPY